PTACATRWALVWSPSAPRPTARPCSWSRSPRTWSSAGSRPGTTSARWPRRSAAAAAASPTSRRPAAPTPRGSTAPSKRSSNSSPKGGAMSRVLRDLHGPLLVVRPPVPATVNKAGVNYKSEVRHLEYSPRGAYDEWLAICEGILAFGGDAIFDFEPEDEPFLDAGDLRLERDGSIRAEDGRVVGHMDEVS